MKLKKEKKTLRSTDSTQKMKGLKARLQTIKKKVKDKKAKTIRLEEYFFYKTKRQRTYGVKKLRTEGYTYFQEFLQPGEANQYALHAVKSKLFSSNHSYWMRSHSLRTYEWR